MKLLIVAGGGGHFAAALSVIDVLPKDVELLVVGREFVFEGEDTKSFEYTTTKDRGIRFVPLISGRLQRKFTRYTIPSLTKIPKGFTQARRIIADFKPDVVISFGGYIAVPVVLAASLMKIPIVLHEQTFEAGLANKISSRFAQIICTSWPESKNHFSRSKIVMTGNPVKKEVRDILHTSRAQCRKDAEKVFNLSREDLPLIYITGGSGGSHVLNEVIKDVLSELLTKYILIHQTGDSSSFNDFETLTSARTNFPTDKQERYILRKFLTPEESALAMHASDMVIGRSGVGTVTELAFLRKNALLIPLATGQKHEQLTNAKFLQKIGLAEILDQHNLRSQTLLAHIEKVLHNDIVQDNASGVFQNQIREAPKKILEQITYVYQSSSAEKKG